MAPDAQVISISSDAAVLDSSVVIKWFREREPLREQALLVRRAYLEGQLKVFVPDLLFYEIANVLRYKSDLSEEHVRVAVQTLFDMKLERLNVTPKVLTRAIEIAYACEVTVYDAVFVACAESIDAVLITADERLVAACEPLSLVRFLGEITS